MTGDTADTADTDDARPVDEHSDADEGTSRRRLIRWIAVLAFGVPVVVELLTFGGLISHRLLPGSDDRDGTSSGESTSTSATVTEREGAVGVGDELLPDVPSTETVEVSEVRGEPGSRTYVLRVAVENATDSSVELRLTGVTLRDGTSLESASSTGTVRAGESGEVTGAWSLPTDSMPSAVDTVVFHDGDLSVERTVPLERPPIRG